MSLVYTAECSVESVSACDNCQSFDDFLQLLSNLPLSTSEFIIDCDRKKVQKNGRHLELTRQERDLLLHLAQYADTVVSRDELLRSVWSHRELDTHSRTVDIHIRRLRVKLADNELISTVRGKGYRLNTNPLIVIRQSALQRNQHTLAA